MDAMSNPAAFGDDLRLPAGMNPEAGLHRVTSDALELAAGRDAAAVTWAQFPYYEARYGERGRMFCDSDTAWLVTRVDAGRQVAIHDIRWLGDVLASRGMPQYLLETHLVNLERALSAVGIWPRSRFAPLRNAIADLRKARLAQVSDEDFLRLAAAFDAEVAGISARVERFGAVLVAAVADERSGIRNALAAVTTWACDPQRFPSRWIEAVRATVASV